MLRAGRDGPGGPVEGLVLKKSGAPELCAGCEVTLKELNGKLTLYSVEMFDTVTRHSHILCQHLIFGLP